MMFPILIAYIKGFKHEGRMNLEAKDVFILELCRPKAFSFPVQAGLRNVLVSKQRYLLVGLQLVRKKRKNE